MKSYTKYMGKSVWVFDGFKRFQDGRENVESDHRSGRPVTSRSEKHIADVCSTVRENRRITIRELSEERSISFGSVQAILTEDLGMRRVSAKFVPKLLSADQKDNRVSAAFPRSDSHLILQI